MSAQSHEKETVSGTINDSTASSTVNGGTVIKNTIVGYPVYTEVTNKEDVVVRPGRLKRIGEGVRRMMRSIVDGMRSVYSRLMRRVKGESEENDREILGVIDVSDGKHGND